MSFSHKVDLHISKSNSGSESPKDRTESRRTEFAKRFETTTKTQENLKRIKETLAKAGTQKIDASTQELLYYKTLINNLEDEKKTLQQKLSEMRSKYKENNCKAIDDRLNGSARFLFSLTQDKKLEIESILGSQDEFSYLLRSNNLGEALLRSLKLNEKLVNLASSGKPHLSDFIEADFSQLLNESNDLAKQVCSQKKQVGKIFKKIDCSLEKSRSFLNSFDVSPSFYSQKND